MAYATLSDIDVTGKSVLVRLDLNVPIKNGEVTDTTRIDASLPTIKHILDHGGKAILMSHFGRPEGKKNDALSLAPVAKIIGEKLNHACFMASDCMNVKEEIANQSLVLLENLRFHPGEEENSSEFTQHLAELGEIYINDAFGTAHRAHASTYGLPLLFKSQNKPVAAGFLMDKELETWKPVLESEGKKVAIIGGAKLKEKMKAVKKFAKTFDTVLIGGVVANVFLNAKGIDIGSSKYLEKGKEYTEDAKA